jgi:hypothetical protein
MPGGMQGCSATPDYGRQMGQGHRVAMTVNKSLRSAALTHTSLRALVLAVKLSGFDHQWSSVIGRQWAF